MESPEGADRKPRAQHENIEDDFSIKLPDKNDLRREFAEYCKTPLTALFFEALAGYGEDEMSPQGIANTISRLMQNLTSLESEFLPNSENRESVTSNLHKIVGILTYHDSDDPMDVEFREQIIGHIETMGKS